MSFALFYTYVVLDIKGFKEKKKVVVVGGIGQLKYRTYDPKEPTYTFKKSQSG